MRKKGGRNLQHLTSQMPLPSLSTREPRSVPTHRSRFVESEANQVDSLRGRY